MKREKERGIKSWELTEDLWVRASGCEPHIRSRGEEKREKEQEAGYKARRRVVEASHSWMNRFRKLLVRHEKLKRNYLALTEFCCAIIIWCNFIKGHL